MAKPLTPDICVIGGGSGGLSVAAAAAAFGVSVVLVERGRMGGDCLNVGCVPSKALLAAARHAQAMREAPAFGIDAPLPEVDFRRVARHIRQVIAAIEPNDSVERFTAMGVHVIQAEARFRDRRTVIAGETEIRARRVVLATGSSPALPAIAGLDTVDVLTNETVFDLTRLPSRLVIIGGGGVGIELAQAFRRLGSDVTVLEAGRALSGADLELSEVVLRALRDEGVEIFEGVRVASVQRRGRSGVRVMVEGPEGERAIDGTHLLVATGRRPNLDGLDLAAAAISSTPQGIRVDDRLRTTNRRVYAIGDALAGPRFTHVAGYDAGLVIRAILFRLRARRDPLILPRTLYSEPELAEIGLGEDEARRRHGAIAIHRWPMSENDRAQAERDTAGMIKVIAGRRGRILGVGIAGAGAGELIGIWALAMARGLTLRDMASYVPAYPTRGEIGKRAAMSYFSGAARSSTVRRIIRFLRLFG